jgi:hypothetical protein
VLVRDLQPAIRRALLPQPETGTLGEALGDSFDEWVERLTLALRTGA